MGFTSSGCGKVRRKQKAAPSRIDPGLVVGYEILHAPSYDKNASDMGCDDDVYSA
jgi:hypothetical protein